MKLSDLNLLSPAKKNKLNQLVIFLFVKEILELVLFITTILAIWFMLGWLLLTNFSTQLALSTTLVNKEYSKYSQDIVEINSVLKNFDLAGSGYSRLSPLVNELATTLPGDIKLTSLAIDRVSNRLSLSGLAKTRDSLLAYHEDLKKIPWLSVSDLSTSQLLEKQDVPFELTASLSGLPPLNGSGKK